MQRLHYTKATKAVLLDQLLAQVPGLTPENTRVESTAAEVWVTVPDGVVQAAVDAVVAAHDAAAIDAATAQAEVARLATDQTERDALAAIRTRQQTYLDTPLASITGAMTVVAVKDLIRLVRWLAWRSLGMQGGP